MNKADYDFIFKVSSRVSHYSQFPNDVCDWIGCQFALESSYGTSYLAHCNQNYCGMKNPLVRISTAIHAGSAYFHWAQYTDLDSCIFDYLLCLQYHRPLLTDFDTINHFARFICTFYCLEKDYRNKIFTIYSQFKNLQNEFSN